MRAAAPLRWRESVRWYDVRGRRTGMWAYALHRITGILLTLYLPIHFLTIGALVRGEADWDRLMAAFRAPPVLVLEVALVAALLYHGLNGIRVVLLALDLGVRRQKAMLWGLMAAGLLVLLYAAARMFRV